MIKKNYKDVHWIHKGTDNIDKVYKGTDLVFEQGYTREQTGVPPITTTYQAIGKNLKDYKIYGNSVQGKLPDTYQQVEYIESTGTQYIDTGYIPDNINGYKIECEVCPTELSNRYCILSGYNATNSISLEITQQNTARAYFYYESASSLNKIFGTITSNKNTLIIEYLNGRFTRTVNGETSSETINLLGTANESMYMFVDRQLRYSTFYKPLKMYKCKLYNNNYLIRDFVPCYRKSDNEVGLYDLVSNTFFTNSGTGTFNKGADTPTPDIPIEIESVGDLITDTNDVNYGKYKVPVIVGNITTNIYLDEPLRKIGDYSDYVDFENSKVVRNISNIDLGTLNWRKSSLGKFVSIDIISNMRTVGNGRAGNAMTTIYKETTASNITSLQDDYAFSSCLNDSRTPFVRDISKIEFTKEEFKVAISGIIMYYVLRTPTEETILLPNIPTIKGTTIFEIDTEIQPSNMYIKYKSK